MGSRGSNHRHSSASSFGNRISFLMLSMLATMASFYVAGRLWQDAGNRVYLINELDKRTGRDVRLVSVTGVNMWWVLEDSYCPTVESKQRKLYMLTNVKSSVSVDDTLKIITCREQQKKLAALHVDLENARQEGFTYKLLSENSETAKKKLLAVIGTLTMFGRKNNRDAIRKAWMPTGTALNKLEEEKGIVIRFVIGRSPNHGDSSDREIDDENRQANDFMILVNKLVNERAQTFIHIDANAPENHVETPEERAKKTKLFFIHAVEHWDAEFYAKIIDDVYVNIDALGAVLAGHLDKPRVYIGCMKSGEVFSQPKHRWYEPDWWKFGDGKSYFQHASGEVFAISQSLAQFVSINRLVLRTYAHDDISVGSWFIGLDVKHIDEGKFCCSSSLSGAICASA